MASHQRQQQHSPRMASRQQQYSPGMASRQQEYSPETQAQAADAAAGAQAPLPLQHALDAGEEADPQPETEADLVHQWWCLEHVTDDEASEQSLIELATDRNRLDEQTQTWGVQSFRPGWHAFSYPDREGLWYWNATTGEGFHASDPDSGWCLYMDPHTGRRWWGHQVRDEAFWESDAMEAGLASGQ